VCIEKVAEMKFLGKTLEDIQHGYPNPEEARLSVLIVEAAREVILRNQTYIEAGKGAPVTAVFNEAGITIFDPYAGPAVIYDSPV